MKLSITTLRTLYRNLEYGIDEIVDEFYSGDSSFRNVITTILADPNWIRSEYIPAMKTDIELMEDDEYMAELRDKYLKSVKELESWLRKEE